MDEWSDFLLEQQVVRRLSFYSYITFPTLEYLTLDFSAWGLLPNEGLSVSLAIPSIAITL